MKRVVIKRIKKILIISIFVVFLLAFLFYVQIHQSLIVDLSRSLLRGNNHSVLSSYIEPAEIGRIEEKLRHVGVEFDSVVVGSDSATFVLSLRGGPVVLLSDKKDIDWQISSLQSIILRLTIEQRSVHSIDFRHSRPVVNF